MVIITENIKGDFMKITRSEVWLIVSLVLMLAGCVVGVCLCALLPFWVKGLALSICGITAIGCYVLYKLNKEELYKTFLVLSILWLCVVWLYVFCEKTGFISVFLVDASVPNREEAIQQNLVNYMEGAGQWAVLVFIFLQFLQTTILPIPSFATTGAGALLCTELYGSALGPLYNSLFSLVGILLGSFTAFAIGRIFGAKLVAWIIGKAKLDKILNMIRGKDAIILTAMFLLPFFPDDILCFVAGMSSMSTKYFVGIMLVSRIVIVFGTSYLFGLIPLTTWWGLLIWGALIVAIALIFLIIWKNRQKLEKFYQEKFCRETTSDKQLEFDLEEEK